MRPYIFFLILFLYSCGSGDIRSEATIIEEDSLNKSEDNQQFYEEKKPECFDEKNKVKMNVILDTIFLRDFNSEYFEKHESVPGVNKDISHEGFPNILKNLDYFLYNEWQLSDEINARIIIGEIPKDSSIYHIKFYNIAVLATYNINGNRIDSRVIGKRQILHGYYNSVTSEIIDNSIDITTHERWTASNGRYYSLWNDENWCIKKNGKIVQYNKLIQYMYE